MSMSPLFAYYSPSNIFPFLREKPSFLLEETAFDGLTLVSGATQVKATDYTQYPVFKHNNAFMKVSVSIPDTAALTDADYIELYIQSGTSVDGGGKIVSPVNVPNLYCESDEYLGKKINSTDIVNYYPTGTQYKQGDKVIIKKSSFDYQADGTYFVTKFISFPLWNSNVTKVGFENSNTTFDKYYGVNIKPIGDFINNADASISVQFVVPNVLMEDIATLVKLG